MKNSIDHNICKQCGTCAALCPNRIIEKEPDGKNYGFNPDRVHLCLKCGHCMAACPNQAVQVEGLSYEDDFFELPKQGLDEQGFFDLISTRRTVRAFKDKPVEGEKLERIIEAISLAPMGFPPHKVQVTVIPDRELLEKALPMLVEFYWKLIGWLENPIARFRIKHKLPLETFNAMQGHLKPILEKRLPYMEEYEVDDIMRGAPAMLIFHAHIASEAHTDDALIDLTYGILAAHAMGLGTCALSLIPPAVNKWGPLKKLFQIPDENEVLAAMVLGYPKYRFQRGIKRELAGVTWLG
ncbi:MAG: nitroreductase family protein [Deltaproteobacteria bacterium]|nr:MAG: nitroreductase family protein [Deltaproteobacteria bacterium]